MKTLMFVTGAAVGAVTSVGVTMGAMLFALNKMSGGELSKVVRSAVSDVKTEVLDKTKER